MKKLLTVLAGTFLATTIPTSVVSCTFGVANGGGGITPEQPNISIPDPSKPTHPNPSKPVLPGDDNGIEIIPNGEAFPDFVDPTAKFKPSSETIKALKLYINNLEDYINSDEYQAIYKSTIAEIEELSGWDSPFKYQRGDSDNEKMMRYFYLYRNNKFLQDYEKKVFDILVYKSIYNNHVEIVNENEIASTQDFIDSKNEVFKKLSKYETPNQLWANNTTKYFDNTIRDFVEPIKK
ncbi:hypothetical protein [Spiroplasma alleghenense]|uniref:Lipoprotein n=1 Tax=Spiroplasma alleghenense TaxID=216931 RepID=A0A345Z4G4_9MOLU|nr:hypothetical protein [Spiroplasma alleghenense]AXK51493.1 hypothetical protein SALLE_v1c08230 [Spiroplasma alleghenense]